MANSAAEDPARPIGFQNRLYLLLENPGKPNNLGSILRCASAFGIRTIVAIGSDKCSVEGSHGASKHVDILAFPNGEEAKAFLQQSCGCSSIVGLLGAVADGYGRRSIEESSTSEAQGMIVCPNSTSHDRTLTTPLRARSSIPVHSYHPSDSGSICFALCKARHGLPISLAKHCDTFVHVPHHAPKLSGEDGDTYAMLPLLDTPSCMSIALHEITRHLDGMSTVGTAFQGQKYTVARAARATEAISTTKRLLRQHQLDAYQKEVDEHHDDTVMLAGDLFGIGRGVDGDY